MSKWGKIEFEKGVREAYDILWEMYEPSDGQGCNFDTEKKMKLLRILNVIDDEVEGLNGE